MANLVATFIARPGNASAIAEIVAAARESVAGDAIWLAEDEAADIVLEPAGDTPAMRAGLERSLRDIIAGRPIDLVVQPAAGRRKRLLVADMDSTMIDEECIDELADFAGLKTEISAVTAQAMRGEIEFEPALRARVALLAGLPASIVDTILRDRVHASPGAATLIATMRAHGAHTVLVSGGFSLFTSRVATALGFDEERANRLVLVEGKLAGSVEEPILGREAKLATLRELTLQLMLQPEESIAIGDGANDLGMILEAGLGVAVHAKPMVADAAPARIDHVDLTGLLFAQGYRKSDFVVAEAAPF